MKVFYILRMNGICYVHNTNSSKCRQLHLPEHKPGDNFRETSHIFFKESKLRICALLQQIQTDRSLVWFPSQAYLCMLVSMQKRLLGLIIVAYSKESSAQYSQLCRYQRNILREAG